MSSEYHVIVRYRSIPCDAAFDSDFLSFVVVLILSNIPVPLSVPFILNGDERRFHIIRQRILELIEHHIVLPVFIAYIGLSVCYPHEFMEFHLIHILGESVEYDQFCRLHFVECKLPHIRVVHHECRRISEHHLLIDDPVLRCLLEQVLQHPHAVVLNQNTFNHVLFNKLLQIIRTEVIPVNFFNIYCRVCEILRLQFYLPLFKKEDQCALAVIEIASIQQILKECCLARSQKTCEQVYRNLVVAHHMILSLHRFMRLSRFVTGGKVL